MKELTDAFNLQDESIIVFLKQNDVPRFYKNITLVANYQKIHPESYQIGVVSNFIHLGVHMKPFGFITLKKDAYREFFLNQIGDAPWCFYVNFTPNHLIHHFFYATR